MESEKKREGQLVAAAKDWSKIHTAQPGVQSLSLLDHNTSGEEPIESFDVQAPVPL